MAKSIFIVGTDTDIGKTFISAGIIYSLNRHKLKACYFKPVQSGTCDTNFIKNISSTNQRIEEMNTYTLKEAVSPHLSAMMENRHIDKTKIIKEYTKLKNKYDYIVIEGAGGVIVPLTQNYYMYDLIKEINTKVIVVAGAGVGTINHTCLTIDFLRRQGIEVSGIVINKYNGKFYEDDNIKMIEKISKVKVKAIINNSLEYNELEEYDNSLNIDKVLNFFKKG